MKKLTIGLLVVLGGCATNANFQKIMQSHMGDSEGQLISSMGPPQSSYALSDGSKILTYNRSGSYQIGGQTSYQPVNSTTNGTISNGYRTSTYQATTTSYQPVQQPTYNINTSCTVNFTVSAGGRVMAWNANGNNCVSK